MSRDPLGISRSMKGLALMRANPVSMSRVGVALSLTVVFFIAAVLYAPGLSGSFLFDDDRNILANARVQIESLSLGELKRAAFSMDSGPLARPLSMLSFAFDYYFHGLDPFYFKLTNLTIHLVTGLALFFTLRLLLELFRRRQGLLTESRRDWIALAITATWLLHPLNLTSVLYVVQRMNSLAGLFTFSSMVLYFYGRQRQFEHKSGWMFMAIAFGVTYPLGVLSKENALLLPVFLLLAEWLLLGFYAPGAHSRRGLIALFVITVGLPAVASFSFLALRFDWLLASYDPRTFDLWERLMTEARVVWFYLGLIALPKLSSLGLYHDDIAISRGLFDPPSTLWAILGLIILLAVSLRLRRRAPMVSFGILFFLAGHGMESTILPLEIAHEHRNYVPVIGILMTIFYYLLHTDLKPKFAALTRSAAFVFFIFMAGLTALRANAWGDPLHHVMLDAAYHPRSSRVNYETGRLYFTLIRKTKVLSEKEEFYKKAEHHFTRAYRNDDYHSGGLIVLLWLDGILGKPINQQRLATLQERLRHVPMSPHNAVSLRNLNQAQIEGDCPLPDGLLDSLFDSTLNNATLKGASRSILLTESLIRALKRRDMRRALELSKEAVDSYPPLPQLWLNRLTLLIDTGQIDEAQEVISKLNGLDLTRGEQESLFLHKTFLDQRRKNSVLPSDQQQNG